MPKHAARVESYSGSDKVKTTNDHHQELNFHGELPECPHGRRMYSAHVWLHRQQQPLRGSARAHVHWTTRDQQAEKAQRLDAAVHDTSHSSS